MSDKEINVGITANASGFGPAMSQAASSVESAARSMTGSLGAMTGAAKTANVALAGLAAVAGAVVAIRELVSHVAELGVQFAKAAQQTGVSATELSALSFVAAATDVSFMAMVKGMEMMDRQLLNVAKGTGPAAEAFKLLGVNVKDASGHLKSNETLLGELADQFASFKDSPEKTALAMRIFGRAGAEMIPILNLGSKGIKQLKADSDALGATMSKELIAKSEQYHHTMVEFHGLMTGIGNMLADFFMPKITWLVKELGSGALHIGEFFRELWINTKNVFASMAIEIVGLGQAMKRVALGDFSGAGDVMALIPVKVKHVWSLAAQEIKADAKAMAAALAALNSTAATSEKGTKNAPPGLDPDAVKKAAQFYLDTLAGAYKDAFELRMATLHEEEASVQGTAVQEAQQVVAIKQKELQQILAMYGQYSVQAIAAEGAIARATRTLHKAEEEETKKTLAAQGALWKSTFQTIGSTFNTVFDGMLRGTQNFRQAFGNMLLGLGTDFIKVLTKMAGQWAAHEALKTGILSSALLERLGITTATGAAEKAGKIVRATGDIGTSAAVGAAAAMADTAELGPYGLIAAPAVGAAFGAAILSNLAGVVASAAGGYDIPAGVNPVTQLHAQEMVLPADLANKIRGSSGGGEIHLHIQAMDAPSFTTYVKNNHAAIAAAVKKATQMGSLTLAPSGTFR